MPEMWFKSINACQLHGESFKMEINTKELEAKVLNYFSEKNKWSTPDKVKVTHSISDASASVVISKMYDFVEFDFEFLEMLSKVFETKKIKFSNRLTLSHPAPLQGNVVMRSKMNAVNPPREPNH